MKKYDFTAEFPRMTDRFKIKVEREVHHQMQCESRSAVQYKRPAKRIVALVCAVVILSGATVYAAAELKLLSFLNKANEDAPALVQNEVNAQQIEDATQPDFPAGTLLEAGDKSAVLTIDEVLFDGAMLHVYASETENGAKYMLNADGILVNGENIANNIFEVTEGGYYIAANLSGLSLPESFTVTLPVSVYDKHNPNIDEPVLEVKRYENQEFTFTVSKNAALPDVTRAATAQRVEGAGFYVDVNKMTLTPTATNIEFNITFTGDGAEAKAGEYSDLLMSAAVGGEVLYGGDNDDLIQGFGGELKKTEDGYAVEGVNWTLRAFKVNGNEITVTPYSHNGDVRDMKTEYSFTVQF